jgi:hypothetical protein
VSVAVAVTVAGGNAFVRVAVPEEAKLGGSVEVNDDEKSCDGRRGGVEGVESVERVECVEWDGEGRQHGCLATPTLEGMLIARGSQVGRDSRAARTARRRTMTRRRLWGMASFPF